jgi:hypothetical protein
MRRELAEAHHRKWNDFSLPRATSSLTEWAKSRDETGQKPEDADWRFVVDGRKPPSQVLVATAS